MYRHRLHRLRAHRPRVADASTVTLDDRRRAGHRARGHLGDARRRDRRRRQSPSSARPTRSRRSAPAASAWSRSKAARAIRPRAPRRSQTGMKVRTQSAKLDAAAPRRDGALHLRSSARLPDLPGQRPLRAAGHGRSSRPHAKCATASKARTTCTPPKDTSNPYFTFDPTQVHRLLALRARLRGGAGHVRADHRRPRLRLEGRPRARTSRSSTRSACPAAPASRPARPRADGEVASSSSGTPERARHDHLRLLRRRLLVQGRDEGRRRSSAWCRTRTATPTTATPASRAASPSATPRTRTASPSR